MYAVMGITGNVGGAVARTLLAKGERVRGMVRNPEKAAERQPFRWAAPSFREAEHVGS
jgi:uncharacterized protein YbjT (DUF2867 family)